MFFWFKLWEDSEIRFTKLKVNIKYIVAKQQNVKEKNNFIQIKTDKRCCRHLKEMQDPGDSDYTLCYTLCDHAMHFVTSYPEIWISDTFSHP